MMKRLRVLHMITRLELGGAQQNTLYTLAHLDRSRFEPMLAGGPGGMLDPEAEQLKDVPVEYTHALVRQIDPLSDIRSYSRIRDILKRLKPHILHTHSSKAGVLGRLAAAAEHVPIIIHTYHGFGFHRYQNPLLFRTYLYAEKKAARSEEHT